MSHCQEETVNLYIELFFPRRAFVPYDHSTLDAVCSEEILHLAFP